MPKIVAEKSDWVQLGFQLFAEHGAAGLVVDTLASKLKCNRSSFYWHFKSKQAFVHAIIDYWVESDTNQIIALAEKADSAHGKFVALVEIAFKVDPYIDFVFHLKRYAKGDLHIRDVIDAIDRERMHYVASLLKQMGFPEADAHAKAALFYKYLIGYHEMLRYKHQPPNYAAQVLAELRQFIDL